MVLSGGQSITRTIRLRLLGVVASSARLAVLSNIEEATPFALAGVYDVWKGDGGKAITSFATITTDTGWGFSRPCYLSLGTSVQTGSSTGSRRP